MKPYALLKKVVVGIHTIPDLDVLYSNHHFNYISPALLEELNSQPINTNSYKVALMLLDMKSRFFTDNLFSILAPMSANQIISCWINHGKDIMYLDSIKLSYSKSVYFLFKSSINESEQLVCMSLNNCKISLNLTEAEPFWILQESRLILK